MKEESKSPIGKVVQFILHPVFLAFSVTIGLCVAYWQVASMQECRILGRFVCSQKFDLFWAASPNEMGDTLAGLAGVLVLVWVVASTFMQSRELKQARTEYSKMATALDAQAGIFADEMRQRQENEAGLYLQRLLEGLSEAIDRESREANVWGRENYDQKRKSFFASRKEETIDEYLLRNSGKVSMFWNERDGEFASGGMQLRAWYGYYEEISKILQKIGELAPKLGNDQQQRLENLRIQKLQLDIDDLVHNGPWSEQSHFAPMEVE